MLLANFILSGLDAVLLIANACALGLIIREGRGRANNVSLIGLEAEREARASRLAITELTEAVQTTFGNSRAILPVPNAAVKDVGTPLDGHKGVREIDGSYFYSAAWLDD